MPRIIQRSLSVSDRINVTGLVITIGLSLLSLAIAYATYRLQRYFHDRYHAEHTSQADDLELQAFLPQDEHVSEDSSTPNASHIPDEEETVNDIDQSSQAETLEEDSKGRETLSDKRKWCVDGQTPRRGSTTEGSSHDVRS
jgi:hypothetical protein